MCGRGRTKVRAGFPVKFEEGWVMLFMTNLYDEKEKRIGLSLTIFWFFIQTSNMDSHILPADLPNTKLNDYNYEQGFDEQLLINSEFADCFSCPICQWNPEKSNRTHIMWPFVLWVLPRETDWSVQSWRGWGIRRASMCHVQWPLSRLSCVSIRRLLYGSEEGLSSGSHPMSLRMPVYWGSTGNGSASIISMWSSRGALSELWMWSAYAISSASRWTCCSLSEVDELLWVVPVACETRTSKGTQLQGKNGSPH